MQHVTKKRTYLFVYQDKHLQLRMFPYPVLFILKFETVGDQHKYFAAQASWLKFFGVFI